VDLYHNQQRRRPCLLCQSPRSPLAGLHCLCRQQLSGRVPCSICLFPSTHCSYDGGVLTLRGEVCVSRRLVSACKEHFIVRGRCPTIVCSTFCSSGDLVAETMRPSNHYRPSALFASLILFGGEVVVDICPRSPDCSSGQRTC
jgi:hypothetical protein